MARYYRCGNPDRPCDLSRTREVVTQAEWTEHCKAYPQCDVHAEEVSWFQAIPPQKRLAGIAGIAVVAALLAFAALKPDPLAKELGALREETQKLESRLGDLEGRPQSGPPAEIDAMKQLPARVQAAEARLATAIRAHDSAAVAKEREEFSRLRQQRSQLGSALGGKPQSGGTVKSDALLLVTSFQELGDRVDAFSAQAASANKRAHTEAATTLQDQLAQDLSRASKLSRASQPQPASLPAGLAGEIDAALARFEKTLASFTPQPFADAEATMKIAITSDLGTELVAPLLKASSSGTAVPVGTRIFYTAASQKIIIESQAGDEVFDGLVAKKYDLVISDLQPTAAQRQDFASAFGGAPIDSHSNAQVIALDALTFVVHPDSAREQLTAADLSSGVDLLGGPAGSPEDAAAIRSGISVSRQATGAPADAVLADESAIGVGLYHREGANIRAKRLAFQATPSSLALKPSPFTIATEDYRYSFRIVAWNTPSASPAAIAFVKFITSAAGQDVVGQQGFVDLRLRPMAGDADPRIMAALGQATGLKKISGAQRLSTNFRFATGEDRFDLKALGDLERVPPQIARDFPSARVVILGFTDSTGGSAVNLPLSQRRAETVAAQLRRAGLDAKTAGMGDQLPVDSNESEAGKARNRRSEVWIVTP